MLAPLLFRLLHLFVLFEVSIDSAAQNVLVLNTATVLKESLVYSKIVAAAQTSLGFSLKSSDVAIAEQVHSCL